jgi:hypothetical protein
MEDVWNGDQVGRGTCVYWAASRCSHEASFPVFVDIIEQYFHETQLT